MQFWLVFLLENVVREAGPEGSPKTETQCQEDAQWAERVWDVHSKNVNGSS